MRFFPNESLKRTDTPLIILSCNSSCLYQKENTFLVKKNKFHEIFHRDFMGFHKDFTNISWDFHQILYVEYFFKQKK